MKLAGKGLILLFVYAGCAVGDDESRNQIYELSLEELNAVKVSVAGLTESKSNLPAASVTVITQAQIQQTPARNLLDLMEVYVPGLIVVRQNIHPANIKIRGFGERNYSILLLVNGKPVNQKNFEGAVAELKNWNLSDIKQVEVVRGPGSATYGAGAITGVINIQTLTQRDLQGFKTGLQFNPEYESVGGDVSFGWGDADSGGYLNLSVTDTDGSTGAREFQTQSNGAFGYKGTDDLAGNDQNPVSPYLSDFEGEPQVKFHGLVNWKNGWSAWVRYGNAGQYLPGSEIEYEGELRNRQQFQSRYYLLALENHHEFNPQLKLDSIVSFDSEDYFQVRTRFDEFPAADGTNRRRSWSEDETFARFTLDWQKDNFEWANVFEYSKDEVGPAWGENASEFRANVGSLVYISSDSIFLGDGSRGTTAPEDVAAFTSGWRTYNWAIASEFNYWFNEDTNLILAARYDDNSFAGGMFSPRVVFNSKYKNSHAFRLAIQNSLRANTSVELYSESLAGDSSNPEETLTFEFGYRYAASDNLEFNITPFYTITEVIGWSGERAELVGEAKVFGIELEYHHRFKNADIGINHSYVDLDQWEFMARSDDGSTRQDISYADFFYRQGFILLESTGKNLNQWVNNTTKLWANYQFNDQWAIHGNLQIFWKREFGADLENMYQQAYADVDISSLSPDDLEDYQEALVNLANWSQMLDDKRPYDEDIRLNLSLSWRPQDSGFSAALYIQNAVNFTANKRFRYAFERQLPVMGWTEEPMAIGLKMQYLFE